MNLKQALKTGCIAVLAACSLATIPAFAQNPGGGGGIPPEMMAKMKAWQKWTESHKNLSNLQTMLMQIREMDKDPAVKLDKSQAQKMLAIYNAWDKKPTMTEDQAKSVSKQVGALLTVKQLKKMTTMPNPFQRRRPGAGAPGGGGPRPGGFKMPDPPKGGYNPMNPDTLPFEQMRPMAKKAQAEFLKELKASK
jgi:hypothetical protein